MTPEKGVKNVKGSFSTVSLCVYLKTMISAKPTEYRNVLFRSQLEARWAVFVDYLKMDYEYEPEWDEVICDGFGVRYKPDFHLPNLDLWIEVKGKKLEELTDIEVMKIVGWGKWESVLILSGPPRLLTQKSDAHYLCTWNPKKKQINPAQRNMWWCECLKCGHIDIRPLGGVPERCSETCYAHDEYGLFGNELPEPDGHKSESILSAYRASRNYRFM